MLRKLFFLTCLGLVTSTAFAQIEVITEVSMVVGSGGGPIQQAVTTLPEFDAGTNTKLVVCLLYTSPSPRD